MVRNYFEMQMDYIFFFYGLSFFSMGFAVLLELGHAPKMEFARALRPLGWFGLVHGGHEWACCVQRFGVPLEADSPDRSDATGWGHRCRRAPAGGAAVAARASTDRGR